MIIYKATNIINGKCYIGQTIFSLYERKRGHINESNNRCLVYFHKAIRKYGKESFIWEVIDDTCQSKEELDEMEYHYIKQYHTHVSDNGYNLTWGFGNTTTGYKFTKKQRERASKCKIGRKHTKRTKRKIGDAQIGGKNHMYGNTGKNHPTSKQFIIIFPDGHTEVITGLTEFCREHNLNRSCMTDIYMGRRTTPHKGYSLLSTTSKSVI